MLTPSCTRWLFPPDGRPIPMVEVHGAPGAGPRDPLCRWVYGPRWSGSSSATGGLEARRTRLAPRPSGEDDATEGWWRLSRPTAVPSRWSRCRGAPATSLETPCAERFPGHGRQDHLAHRVGLSLWSSQTTDAVPAGPGAGNQVVGLDRSGCSVVESHGASVIRRHGSAFRIHAGGWDQPRVAVESDDDVPSVVVNIIMATGAQQASVVEVGGPAVGPVVQMVSLAASGVGSAFDTSAITHQQRFALPGGEEAFLWGSPEKVDTVSLIADLSVT